MADIIPLFPLPDEAALAEMDRGELTAQLSALRSRIAQLDTLEPEDMESEAYEAWGDQHEELEDLADAILERMDELHD